jgi:hypothetical protein
LQAKASIGLEHSDGDEAEDLALIGEAAVRGRPFDAVIDHVAALLDATIVGIDDLEARAVGAGGGISGSGHTHAPVLAQNLQRRDAVQEAARYGNLRHADSLQSGASDERMARPACKDELVVGSGQSASTYPVSGRIPAKMEIRAARSL